jgi:hypothetical protein
MVPRSGAAPTYIAGASQAAPTSILSPQFSLALQLGELGPLRLDLVSSLLVHVALVSRPCRGRVGALSKGGETEPRAPNGALGFAAVSGGGRPKFAETRGVCVQKEDVCVMERSALHSLFAPGAHAVNA